jgi:hypothetical protein
LFNKTEAAGSDKLKSPAELRSIVPSDKLRRALSPARAVGRQPARRQSAAATALKQIPRELETDTA